MLTCSKILPFTMPTQPFTSTFIITTTSPSQHAQVVARLMQIGGTCANGLDSDGRFCASGGTEISYAGFPHVYVRVNQSYGPFQIEAWQSGSDLSMIKIPQLTAPQFLVQYPAPGGAAVQASGVGTPETNPANFIVDTGGNPTLSRIVQELAFKAGVFWAGELTGQIRHTDKTGNSARLIVTRAPTYEPKANLQYNPTPDLNDTWPVYSAATQMGLIVEMLATPPAPPKPPAPVPPRVHDYPASYVKSSPCVVFGCANLGIDLLTTFRSAMTSPFHGNRKVASITLDSGKTLSMEQIQQVLAYVAAVDQATT